ncbi:MAG: type IX secretion system sortase PorU [Rhodothermales bacterium]|nr:type IX secretion system sortase PorU [Rhodothermales bacterium]
MIRRLVRLFLFGTFLVLGAAPVRAQQAQVRTLDVRPEGVVVEMEAAWRMPLRAALDSAQVDVFGDRAVLAASRGMLTLSETVFLPALAAPSVRVLAADFDEVPLPVGEAPPPLLDALAGDPARALGLGVERKRPAVTLEGRMLHYDPQRQVLRRYRRLVVSVEYGAGRARPGQPMQPFASFSANAHLGVAQSVLADGTVYKLAIQESGVYRIDRALLASLPGFEGDARAIDPATIRIYHNGGRPLPALNRAPRPADLVENRVFVRGGGDGTFDDGDVLLFYAEGPGGWEAVPKTERNRLTQLPDTLRDVDGQIIYEWQHVVHPFDTESYVFVKIGGGANAQVGPGAYPGFADADVQTQIQGLFYRDFDDILWGREGGQSGHTFVSTLVLGGSAMTVLDGAVLPGFTGGEVTIQARPAVQSNPAAAVSFRSGGAVLATARPGTVGTAGEDPIALPEVVTFTHTPSGPLDLSMSLENVGSSPQAALDWVRVFYPRALRAEGGVLAFHTPVSRTGRFEFVLDGFASEPQVWDVTDPADIRRLGTRADGGRYRVQVEATDRAQPRRLVAFTEAAARSLAPEAACPGGCRVTPQNLHGIQSFPQFVIVTPAAFRPQAEALAERRRADGLGVEVVDVEQIYNEFGGGQLDPRALRDYFRFLYDRTDDEGRMLRYVLLFGDGHYDYRNIGGASLTNWIPPFETEESLDPERSYTSDDYFGLLDDDEGRWYYTRRTWTGSNQRFNERVDLGIGRFTVQTEAEAAAVLDKIQRYESPATYEAWRTRYLFLADDALNGQAAQENDADLHVQNTDVVAQVVEDVAPEINQKKVYAISYQREFRDIWRIPGARQDLLTALREGVLVFNYSGHGGEDALAQEELFTLEDAQALQNRDRLPVFITATCSFGRWDLGNEQSGAEALLTNPDGGAVAMMTTVRTVFTTSGTSSLNVGLNIELNRQLFEREANGLPRRLGDVLRDTKNTRVGYEGNNRKFNLLGDPTMRLGLPAYEAAVTGVNGVPVAEQTAPIRALDRVTIAGEIRTPDGQVVPDFDGPVELTVFDAQRRVALPVRVYMRDPYYVVREDLLWRGTVQAEGGRFAATFVVPKDISYSNEPGRIAVYAAGQQTHAAGFTENVVVGGTADNPAPDAQGPRVALFMNDETFVSGGLVPPRPELIVRLEDESGINTVGAGVGHELLLVLDGDEQNALDIGDLYQAEENSFQKGSIRFEFEQELAPGPHTVSVRAWDVFNNSTTAALDFVVTDGEALVLRNVFNYPNPTTGPTRFVFEHNQPVGTLASVRVRVYTLSGRAVRTLELDDVPLTAGPMPVAFDGRDDDFDVLAPGIYLYKVRVEVDGADGERQVSEHIEKLAVIR